MHYSRLTTDAPPEEPCEYPLISYIFINYNHRPTFCHRKYRYIFVEIFLVGSINFFAFLHGWLFSRSGTSKVIDFGTNRKRVCNFFLVRQSNLGVILQHFGDIAAFMCSWPHPYSTLILGVFPLHQIAHVGVNVSRCLKLFGREIIFKVFQPMW